MTPPFEEVTCFALVALYLGARLGAGADRRWLLRLGAIAVAAWIAEDSCIRAYGFYAYDAGWRLMLDRVPLAVIMVWPVVIDSAGRLVRALGAAGCVGAAVLTGLLVLTDAAVIEPVSVQGGLWRWFEPGLFAVPPIGMLGWGIFAAWAHGVLGDTPTARRAVATVAVVPLLTHGSLLLLWWGALRWLNLELPQVPAVVLAWVVALGVGGRAARRALPALPALMARAPGAGFFFVLVFVRGRDHPLLLAWVAAFALPYGVLVVRHLARWRRG